MNIEQLRNIEYSPHKTENAIYMKHMKGHISFSAITILAIDIFVMKLQIIMSKYIENYFRHRKENDLGFNL